MSLTPFTFFLDWIAGAQFAGLYRAKALGLYETAGLDVTLVPWVNDGQTVWEKVQEMAASGSLGAGCMEDNLIIRCADVDRSVVAFGAMLQRTALALMSKPEQGIANFSDLRGKCVGMHTDGIRALQVILALEGIDKSELDLLEVGFDLDHLTSGKLDAVQGYVMTEPIQLRQRGVEVDVMQVQHHQLRPHAQVYFSTPTLLATHQHTFSAFLNASTLGWQHACADPESTASVLPEVLGDAHQASTQLAMLRSVIPLVFGSEPVARHGRINMQQWDRNLQTYFQFGFTDRQLQVDDVVFEL